MKRLALALVTLAAARAWGDAPCRVVQVTFEPAPRLQLAVWLEDGSGRFVDTIWLTRSTGALGLGNRPGNAQFKSAYRWPYGRREMVLPVWAHAHGKQYPFVTMGGASGVDNDDSIGYHELYSSPEAFYCPPSNVPLDAVSCASQFVGSKGVYVPGRFSWYPPRADLTSFASFDSQDARNFAAVNDVAAISGATPPGNAVVDPLTWHAPPGFVDGNYVVKVEASLEGDVNADNMHPSFPDYNHELQGFGHDALGQGSVVYAVPITVDGTPRTATSDGWIGYGDWDGATGTLHAPDDTISDVPGSGAGRLAHVTDGDGTWRVKVFASGCQGCRAPAAPTMLAATPADTAMTLAFAAPASTDELDRPRRYEIRYQAKVPLDDASFEHGIPADMPPPPAPGGQAQTAKLTGLKAQTLYYVGIRALNACAQPGPAAYATATTLKQQFVVLHGCFIATAAYGSAMAGDVALLRRFRDGALFGSTLGRLAVAAYYALSPPLARAISVDERLRAAARRALAPAVALARAWDLSEHRAR